MNNMFLRIMFMITLFAGLTSCEEDYDIGEIKAPTDLTVQTQVMGQTDEMPQGDGSGEVTFTTSATGAMTYKYIFGDGNTIVTSKNTYTHQFSETGDFTVSIIAYGPGGTSTSTTSNVQVFVSYQAPQDLIDKLVGDGTKEWRVKAEAPGHFGLGPVGGNIPTEWYAAGPNEKDGSGMYDDRYLFKEDGTFIHITDINTEDESGTIFGRINLVDQLGSSGGTVQGADVLNVPLDDQTGTWSIIAPGGNETIALSGLNFIGYYTGGDHRYQIFDRSVPNELILKTTDGNSEFDWWFILTSGSGEETGGGEEAEFETQFTNLVWSDEFDGDSLNTDFWNYETGNGTDGWGNNELQYYTQDNVTVQDGSLIITAKKESESGFDYTSGRITTKDNYEFTYGRVEASIKLPEGAGTWPAFWMLGANFDEVGWPQTGEIDILEWVGKEPGRIQSALHFPGNSGGNAVVGPSTIENPSSEFHTYTAEWTEDTITFLLDGEVYFTFDNDLDKPFNKDFFLILNVAMGGNLGGDVDPAFSESAMEIDYVKVYQ